MSEWFCHEPGRGRVGPYSAEDMRRRFRERHIQHDTLVWREGLPEWQPLERVLDELDLLGVKPDASLPPPLPATMPSPLGSVAAGPGAGPGAFGPAGARVASVRTQPPRSGLSGCAIVAIVIAVLAVPMLAILAAIALPAYQDYVVRSKVTTALAESAPVQQAVARHLLEEGECPDNETTGFLEPTRYAARTIRSVRIGSLADGRCAYELELRGHARLEGETLLMIAAPSGSGLDEGDPDWACGGSLPARYLPASCRPPSSP